MTANMNSKALAMAEPLKMNTFSVSAIFDKYEAVGFLYPAKKKLLAPHFHQITKNWEQLYHTPERLLWTLALTDEKVQKNFASISIWRQSNYGFVAQHLVSTGNPFLSLKVMLRAQSIAAFDFGSNEIKSSQNWFRPNNRYAYRVFASMYKKLGPAKSSLIPFQYLQLPLDQINSHQGKGFNAEPVDGIDNELIQFVQTQYGNVFIKAEELDQADIELRNIGNTFQKYGFNRYRKIYKFRDQNSGKIVAAIIANRAPIGLNFSFLENRAYYLLDPALSNEAVSDVLKKMNATLHSVYADFELQSIPIVTDSRASTTLQLLGANFQREYMQSIWMRDGFAQWYDHIHSFLQRIEKRDKITC